MPQQISTKNYRIRVTVKKTGKDMLTRISTLEKSLSELFPKAITTVRDKVLSDLQMYINSKRKRGIEEHTENWRYRARNNLYNVIEAGTKILQTRTNRFVLTIGETNFLEKSAPYYLVLNYGGYVPNPAWGYFGKGRRPQSDTDEREIFHYTGKYGRNPYARLRKGQKGGVYYMIPTKPIRGIYYLNRMAAVTEIELKSTNQEIVNRMKEE